MSGHLPSVLIRIPRDGIPQNVFQLNGRYDLPPCVNVGHGIVCPCAVPINERRVVAGAIAEQGEPGIKTTREGNFAALARRKDMAMFIEDFDIHAVLE